MSKSIEKDRRSVKRLRPEESETTILNTAFEDLLELGRGFAFVGSQVPLVVEVDLSI
jgi:hypothetical protein